MSGKIRHETSTKLTITHGATLGELIEAVHTLEVPHSAKMTVTTYAGDQRDPGYSQITLRWTQ